jgi:hypothetical protein
MQDASGNWCGPCARGERRNRQLNRYVQLVPRDLAVPPTLYRTSTGREMIAATGKDGRVYGIDVRAISWCSIPCPKN